MNRLYTYLYICLSMLFGQSVISAQQISPMASGRWAKVAVSRSGLHSLDRAAIESLGFERLDAVRVWGYGGGLLPEQIVGLSGRGLTEVPTLLIDGQLYFYAEGATSWQYHPTQRFFVHTTNHYTREGYYLLSEGGAPMRMQTLEVSEALSTEPSDAIATTLHVEEKDEYSLSKSGRHLYGASMQAHPKLSYQHSYPDAIALQMRYSYMAYPKGQSATLMARINGQKYAEATITPDDIRRVMSSGDYKVYGVERTQLADEVNLDNDKFHLDFELTPTGYPAHFDFYELNIRQRIRLKEGQLYFTRPLTSVAPDQEQNYLLEGTQGAYLFAINSLGGATLIRDNISAQRLALKLRSSDALGRPIAYLMTPLSRAYRPRLIGKLPNQNLLGAKAPADLLIITTTSLLPEAKRLAEHYEKADYRVEVATQQEVFNEFNGGTPDATAYRLWARLHYDLHKYRAPNKDVQMQLLLFGDAAYDNRKMTQDWQLAHLKDTEFLLSYQSVASLDLSSYTSDDYFGVLADERAKGVAPTGLLRYPMLKELPMDIGVGRLPVRTPSEARAVVDKIIRYETALQQGSWKMKAVFLADNGDANSHTRQSIEITDRLEHQVPSLELSKVYMSAYPRVNVGGMTTVPGAHRAFMEALNSGVLIANYNGHGSPKLWADEQVLTINDIHNFNYPHLPLWITATCDFGGFDAPSTSAGEEILLHPTSGGIALLSTTRVVWDIPNQMLNMALLKELFTPQADGRYRPLGTVVRDAKNSLLSGSSPENRLNFVLLGSPLLRLPLPASRAIVSDIAGEATTNPSPIKLHALERITLNGYIQTERGEIDGDFSGSIELTIYDGEEELETIDNFSRHGGYVRPAKYRTFRNVIYTGHTEVHNGRYSIQFNIPKDVAYSGRKGRISLYAYDPKRALEVSGLSTDFVITPGEGRRVNADTEAPKIRLISLTGRDVRQAPRIPRSALLRIELSDESALNLSTAGVGHRATLTLDNDAGKVIDLTPYYQADPTREGHGSIAYFLDKLEEGEHTARLEVWDIHNNMSRTDFRFIVQAKLRPLVKQLQMRPNPITRAVPVSIFIEHDLLGADLSARLAIYDLSGQLIWEREGMHIKSSTSTEYTLTLGADLLPNLSHWPRGTYLLRVWLSSSGGAEGTASTKFSIY